MSSSDPAPRRYEQIVRDLEDSMLSGALRPGERLPSERDLMTRYNAGRSSVREALFALRKMGLVDLSSGERACVTRPSVDTMVRELSGAARQFLAAPEGVRHFQHARRLFERALAREAATRATPERLQVLFAAMEAHRIGRSGQRAVAADVDFHFRIAEMSGNPALTALHTALLAWLTEQRSTSVQSPGAKRAAAAAHRRIYDAIASGDPDAADRAMHDHLIEVEKHYWRVLDGREAAVSAPLRRGTAR